MGVFGWVKRKVSRSKPSAGGKIYLKPSETPAAQGLVKKTGASISVTSQKPGTPSSTTISIDGKPTSVSTSSTGGSYGGATVSSGGGGGRVYQGPTRPGTDVETFIETGVSAPKTITSGAGAGALKTEQEKTQFAARAGAITRREQASLITQQQMRRRALETGKGYSKTQLNQRLREQGLSLQELRRGRRKVKSRITEREPRKEEKIIVKEFPAQPIRGGLRKEAKQTKNKIVQTYTNINQYLSARIPTLEEVRTRLTSRLSPEGKKVIEERIKEIEKTESKSDKFYRGVGTGVYEDIQQKPLKQILTFGAGAGTSLVLKGTALGLGAAGKIGAVRALEKGAKFGGVTLTTAYGIETGARVAQTKGAEEKGKVVGTAGKDLALFGMGYGAGSKGFDKGVDIVRTYGTRRLPLVELKDTPFQRRGRDVYFERTASGQFKKQKYDIVAKEYMQGQKYPLVKPGQTVKELRAEFYKPSLPGERLDTAYGYHAAPGMVKGKTTIEAGGSELPGFYTAGRLSPTFLKLSPRNVASSIRDYPIDFFKKAEGSLLSTPTIIRLNLGDVGYAPGVKGSAKVGERKLDAELKRYYGEEIRGTGKTDIPSIKREKEAITAWDTPIQKVTKDYSISFEGRKIPVVQYKIVPEGTQGARTIKDIMSLGKTGRSSYVATTKSLTYSPTTSPSMRGYSSGVGRSSYTTTSPYRILSSGYPKRSSTKSSKRSSTKSPLRSYRPSIPRYGIPSTPGYPYRYSSSYTPRRPQRDPPRYPPYYPGTPYKKKKSSLFADIQYKPTKKTRGTGYTVELRRFGKFKTIGTGSLRNVMGIGKRATTQGLGATYRIKGADLRGLKVPRGYYGKQTKTGLEIIERRGRRLKRGTKEIPEIQRSKRRKRK